MHAAGGRHDSTITGLLKEWQAGNHKAQEQLISAVYDGLRRIARSFLNRERCDLTLQPTELVNEAYLRLCEQKDLTMEDRIQFFAITARLMRQILIEHVRKKKAAKRGGEKGGAVALEDMDQVAPEKRPVDLLELDHALKELEAIDAHKCRLVELRYFAGLTLEETAKALKISVASVKREWVLAKAWLYRYLSGNTR